MRRYPCGMLFINNDDVAKVLTMDATYRGAGGFLPGPVLRATRSAGPRIDIRIPGRSSPARRTCGVRWKEASTGGYFAVTHQVGISERRESANGATTLREILPPAGTLPAGWFFSTSIETGEPLADHQRWRAAAHARGCRWRDWREKHARPTRMPRFSACSAPAWHVARPNLEAFTLCSPHPQRCRCSARRPRTAKSLRC